MEARKSFLEWTKRTIEAAASFDGSGPNAFYEPILPENYEESWCSPAFAKEQLGREGVFASAFAADLMGLAAAKAQGREEWIGLFSDAAKRLAADGADFCAVLFDFYQTKTDGIIAASITDMILPQPDGFFERLLRDADLSDPSYLDRYGFYIGENERGLSSFLNEMPQEKIDAMARTYTEGYRIGFLTTQKDISKKKTVKIEYPVGFERVAKAAAEQFLQMGLKPTYVSEPLFSVQGRAVDKRGVYGTAVNKQFLYDHKDDRGLYLDESFVNHRLDVMERTFQKHEKMAKEHGGPAVIEVFGEADFTPVNKKEAYSYTQEQNVLNVRMASEAGQITDRFIPGSERSFTIIAYPVPQIGEKFREIFEETVRINTLDYHSYQRMQQALIDVLDRGGRVRVTGRGSNETDMTVILHPLTDPAGETVFENCVADVNIPVGEVFTSPVLEGTHGTLHVGRVYLGDYEFKDLKLTFEDGMVTGYSCANFNSEEENKKLIFERILFRHETLPIGEFAIGTNTTAYRMAKDYGIGSKLPILIAEKTGPHFAVGDTCYSHAEDVVMKNPDGKECVARDNSVSILRKTDPAKAYFNCHTDITIPFEELGAIVVIDKNGQEYDIIRDGRFVVPGTEELNEPLTGID